MATFDFGGGSIGGLPYSGGGFAGYAPASDNLATFGEAARGADTGGGNWGNLAGLPAGYATGKGLSAATGQSPYSLGASSWFKGADTTALNAIERAPASFDWANLGGGLVDFAANAGAGYAGSKLAAWDNSPGEAIGGSIGGAAGGWALGPPGAFLGSAIGTAIGSNFGPPPTVGPNGQVWLAPDEFGFLSAAGASGDNGMTGDDARGYWANAIAMANMYGRPVNLPQHAQIRAGGMGADPTIELGGYMAPFLNDMSLVRALAARGHLPGVTLDMLGGADPERIFTSGKWVEPESIHPIFQGGIYSPQHAGAEPGTWGADAGFRAYDSGRVGNAVPQAYTEMAAHGIPMNDSTLRQWAAGAYGEMPAQPGYAMPQFDESTRPTYSDGFE